MRYGFLGASTRHGCQITITLPFTMAVVAPRSADMERGVSELSADSFVAWGGRSEILDSFFCEASG